MVSCPIAPMSEMTPKKVGVPRLTPVTLVEPSAPPIASNSAMLSVAVESEVAKRSKPTAVTGGSSEMMLRLPEL